MIFAMKLKGKSTLNKGDLDQDMNKNRGNETHHVLLAYEFISYGPILLICTPPPPLPSPLTKLSQEVDKNTEFLKVVGLNTRFSEGK